MIIQATGKRLKISRFPVEDRRIPAPVQDPVDDHGQRHGDADPLVQLLPRDLAAHQAEQQQKQERVNDQAEGISFAFLHESNPYRSIHACSSLSEIPELKRVEGRKVPVPACSPSVSPVRPAPLPPEVQKGTTVIPVKS